ncbi:FtsX-like permease family protein [Robiginitalea sp.]|nr:FtsX-like permease family protein [Robiginitalea sp.]
MNVPLFIAKRYLRSKSSQNAVNIINAITFAVIVIGSAALFIVLSGFSGLKNFSLSFSNTFDPHLKAIPASGKVFTLSEDQARALTTLPGIISYSKELEERVYLTHDQKSMIAYIKGVDGNYTQTTAIDSAVFLGQFDLSLEQTVAGIGIASLLNLSLNDFRSPLAVLAPKPGNKGSPTQRFSEQPYNQLYVVMSGIYQVEEELDKKYIFTELPVVQALLERDSTQISGLNFKLDPAFKEESVRREISALLGDAVLLKNRRELNQTLYRMLNTENLATYLIFTLVLIIALFNVVGAIIMMILDKKDHLKTLFALGLTHLELRRVYFLQGVLLTSLGGLIGVFLGVLLIGSQLLFGWLLITPSLAYPVALTWENFGIVLLTIILLGILASKIASSRIRPKILWKSAN